MLNQTTAPMCFTLLFTRKEHLILMILFSITRPWIWEKVQEQAFALSKGSLKSHCTPDGSFSLNWTMRKTNWAWQAPAQGTGVVVQQKQDSWVLMDLLLTTSLLLDKLDSISETHARDIYLNVYHVSRVIWNSGTTLANEFMFPITS